MITQDKNKYGAPKYRLVVRISNRYCRVQVVKALLDHDEVICTASSQELPRYGVSMGLKSYPACYATGLLCARRLLQKYQLDTLFAGVEEPEGEVKAWDGEGEEIPEGARENGKKYYVENATEEDKKPFRAFLDIGIRTATRGSRVFAAMKGASDGGMDIPHNARRFPGYDPDAKTFDADDLKSAIMGARIQEYMDYMEDDDEENYAKYFKSYIDKEVEDVETMYTECHEKIRADPSPKKGLTFDEEGNVSAFTYKKNGSEVPKPRKKSYAERRAAIDAKKAALNEADDED